MSFMNDQYDDDAYDAGADEADAYDSDGDYGDDDFDYDEYVQQNHSSGLASTELKPIWRFVAVGLLLLVALAFALQVMSLR